MLSDLTFEVLSLTSILNTPLRELPTALLRVGWLELDGVCGLQLGPVVVWHEVCGEGVLGC